MKFWMFEIPTIDKYEIAKYQKRNIEIIIESILEIYENMFNMSYNEAQRHYICYTTSNRDDSFSVHFYFPESYYCMIEQFNVTKN